MADIFGMYSFPTSLHEHPLRGVKGFHLARFNCRSIPASFEENRFNRLKYYYCLEETLLNDMLPSCNLYIPGYRWVRLDRQVLLDNGEYKTAGGVGYYISLGISASHTELPHLNIIDEDIELQ